jgi:hypothetical protein
MGINVLQIPLQPIPNQKFSIQLDENFYDITIKATGNTMACDIIRNNEVIETGIRIVANEPLIVNRYQESGNFTILSQNDDYAYYPEFNNTQFLIYISQSELNAIRSAAGLTVS